MDGLFPNGPSIHIYWNMKGLTSCIILFATQGSDTNIVVDTTNGKFNHIDRHLNLISKGKWWDDCDMFKCGWARVWDKTKGYNFINKEGGLISPDIWWDACGEFKENISYCRKNEKVYNIDTKGVLKFLYNRDEMDSKGE